MFIDCSFKKIVQLRAAGFICEVESVLVPIPVIDPAKLCEVGWCDYGSEWIILSVIQRIGGNVVQDVGHKIATHTVKICEGSDRELRFWVVPFIPRVIPYLLRGIIGRFYGKALPVCIKVCAGYCARGRSVWPVQYSMVYHVEVKTNPVTLF